MQLSRNVNLVKYKHVLMQHGIMKTTDKHVFECFLISGHFLSGSVIAFSKTKTKLHALRFG